MKLRFAIEILCLIGICISSALGSDYYTTNFSHPDYPGKCYISKDLIVEPGRHRHPQFICQEIECRDDGTGDIITSHPAGCQYR